MFNSAALAELQLSHTMPQAEKRRRSVSSRGRASPSWPSIRSTALSATMSSLAPSGTGTAAPVSAACSCGTDPPPGLSARGRGWAGPDPWCPAQQLLGFDNDLLVLGVSGCIQRGQFMSCLVPLHRVRKAPECNEAANTRPDSGSVIWVRAASGNQRHFCQNRQSCQDPHSPHFGNLVATLWPDQAVR